MAHERGLGDRVEIRDRFIPNDEAALLFGAAMRPSSRIAPRASPASSSSRLRTDAPSSQRASAGLPAAVTDGVDGLLCEPDAADVAAAIERMAREHASTRRGGARRQRGGLIPSLRRALDDAVGGALVTTSGASAPTRRSRSPATRRSKLSALVVILVARPLAHSPGVRRPRDWARRGRCPHDGPRLRAPARSSRETEHGREPPAAHSSRGLLAARAPVFVGVLVVAPLVGALVGRPLDGPRDRGPRAWPAQPP